MRAPGLIRSLAARICRALPASTRLRLAPESLGLRLPVPNAANFRMTALIIASAMFMETLDATILATALPTMARSFHVSPAHLSIALTSYLLSLAVLIPASGEIADRYGARRVFSAAIAVFMLGSLCSALAPSFSALIAARLLQGAGGAMMLPVGRLVMLRNVEKRDLVSAMGWMLTPGLIGPVLGPPVGGFIVTYFDWRWIFYINLPIGVIGMALTQAFIPDIREPVRRRFDTRGFVLSGIALSCLLFGFETLSRGNGAELWLALALIAAGTIAGAGYVAHARGLRGTTPLLDLSLMRIPTFRVSVIAGALTRITQGAQPFLLPLMMQIGFGMSAAESGLLTFSTACGFVAMKSLAAPILGRVGFRTTLIWNSVISSVLFAACALFRPGWPHWAMFAVLLLCGLSMSLQFAAYNAVCYDEIPASRTAAANSFYTTFQQLMLSAGICTAAMALTGSKLIFGHAHPGLTDFSFAFLVVTAISLLAAPINAALPQDAGMAMTRRGAAAHKAA